MKKLLVMAIAAVMVATTPLADFCNGLESVNSYAASYDYKAASNIVNRIHAYMQPYLGANKLTNYQGKASLCHALVNYVWKNVFGVDLYMGKSGTTPPSNDYSNLGAYVNAYARPGDILRVDGKHSMVIISFDADTVTGYEWLTNKKERFGTYTWDGVRRWGNGSQNYWLYQVDDSIYNSFGDGTYIYDMPPARAEWFERDNDESIGTIKLQIGNPVIDVNGTQKPIDAFGNSPIILNGTTMVPIRAIVEAMGGGVGWDEAKQLVSLCYNGNFVYLTLGSNTMVANNQNLHLQTPPTNYYGTTLLPVKAVIENLDGAVMWDDQTQTLTIKYKKAGY
ncbi:MAG: copper amine oxidase N-terminal domain-containing protein [Clostridia bacterium]|nr:copper amine oxidase N-terminal domain-containing protein [Clostridia bacterium]